jgi:hypothetical protein
MNLESKYMVQKFVSEKFSKIWPPEKVDLPMVEAWQEYRKVVMDDKDARELLLYLDEFFSEAQPEAIKKVWDTHWLWYVDLTWRFLQSLDKYDFERLLLPMLASAYRLGYRVEEKIFSYWHWRVMTLKDLREMYRKFQKEARTSTFLANPTVSEDLTIAKIGEGFSKKGVEDGIEKADFLANVENILFPADSPMSFVDDTKNAENTGRFLDMLNFFYEDRDIEAAISQYMAYLDGDGEAINDIGLDVDGMVKDVFQKVLDKKMGLDEKNTNLSALATEAAMDNQPSKPSDSLVNYNDLRDQMLTKFTVDENGNFVNPEEPLVFLDKKADELDDEKIRDLYFFDEEKDDFSWNEEIFNV